MRQPVLHFILSGARGGARLLSVARRGLERGAAFLEPVSWRRCVLYALTSLGEMEQQTCLEPVCKMTTHAELAVRTTLREAYSDSRCGLAHKISESAAEGLRLEAHHATRRVDRCTREAPRNSLRRIIRDRAAKVIAYSLQPPKRT